MPEIERIEVASTEYGIGHPDGRVSVRVDGFAFPNREEARRELEKHAYREDCWNCEPGKAHWIVLRVTSKWRAAE